MTRPDAQVTKSLAKVNREHTELVAFFETWRDNELTSLPLKLENTALFQGRCQVLTEVVKLLKQAPELAAKL